MCNYHLLCTFCHNYMKCDIQTCSKCNKTVDVKFSALDVQLRIGLATMRHFCVIFRVADDSEIRVSVMMFNAPLKNN